MTFKYEMTCYRILMILALFLISAVSAAASNLPSAPFPQEEMKAGKAGASRTLVGIDELTVYTFIQNFIWKEFVDERLFVKENGTQYGAGVMLRVDLTEGLIFQAKGELFKGDVDYDGVAQFDDGSSVPLKSKVGYFGAKMEGDMGWRFFPSESVSVEPFLGLGYRWWQRDIPSSYVDGNPVIGYIEEWDTLYGRSGLRAGYFLSDRTRLFAEVGAKWPLNNNSRADLGTGSSLLKPGKERSAFGEIGVRRDRIRASLYYEGFRFSESPAVNYALQPKSKSDIFGIMIGWCFR